MTAADDGDELKAVRVVGHQRLGTLHRKAVAETPIVAHSDLGHSWLNNFLTAAASDRPWRSLCRSRRGRQDVWSKMSIYVPCAYQTAETGLKAIQNR